LSTSSQRHRGLLGDEPDAGGGSLPLFTHRSHVSGEISSSAAPVSRETYRGVRLSSISFLRAVIVRHAVTRPLQMAVTDQKQERHSTEQPDSPKAHREIERPKT
jgi:hypothetical protein